MSKPSGKLEFAYRTIATLESTVTDLRQQLADVSHERDLLRAFANEMVNASYEGGGFDAADLQEIAERNKLVRLIAVDSSCGDGCSCAQYGFPGECYRKNQILCDQSIEQQVES